jgi:predicted RecB family nuclease
MKDMFERLRLDPGSRTLGQLIQERQWVTSRDLVVKQRIFDYNEDDCVAMRVLLDAMRAMSVRPD